MTDKLLNQINHNNRLYREWKSPTDINQYNGRKIHFKTSEFIFLNIKMQNIFLW